MHTRAMFSLLCENEDSVVALIPTPGTRSDTAALCIKVRMQKKRKKIIVQFFLYPWPDMYVYVRLRCIYYSESKASFVPKNHFIVFFCYKMRFLH